MEAGTQPSMHRNPPQVLKAGAILVVNLFGLLLGLPVLVAVAWVSFRPLDPLTYILPLAAFAFAALCLPTGLGNPWMRMLCRKLRPPFETGDAHVVQLTARPRLQTGLRALFEDADDIGHLKVDRNGIEFFGDSTRIQVPREYIQSVRMENIGVRGLFIYGSRIVLEVRNFQPATLEFAERETCFLFSSRKKARQLFERVKSA